MDAIASLVKLFERAEREGCTSYGLWHERGSLSYADVMAGPCEFKHLSPRRRPNRCEVSPSPLMRWIPSGHPALRGLWSRNLSAMLIALRAPGISCSALERGLDRLHPVTSSVLSQSRTIRVFRIRLVRSHRRGFRVWSREGTSPEGFCLVDSVRGPFITCQCRPVEMRAPHMETGSGKTPPQSHEHASRPPRASRQSTTRFLRVL